MPELPTVFGIFVWLFWIVFRVLLMTAAVIIRSLTGAYRYVPIQNSCYWLNFVISK